MKSEKKDITIQEFTLSSGPLHRQGCRLRLVRGATNTVRLGFALGLSAWVVMILLAFLQGHGTPDLQSLADLANSISIVRNMRGVPLSPRLTVDVAMAVLAPALPLLLLKYPIAELAEKLLTRLSGL